MTVPAKTSDRTMLSQAPAFSPSGKAWRPYRPRGLEQVSRSSMTLTERLFDLIPLDPGKLAEALQARIRELFDVELRLYLDHIHVVRPQELSRRLSMPSYLAALSPAPHKAKGLLEVELALAHATVDVMLGGGGDAVAVRPLTEVEEGMMSFVVLEALRAVSPSLEAGLPKMRFDGTLRTLEDANQVVGEEEQLLVVQLKGVLGSHAGFIRLFVPGSIMGLRTPVTEGPERAARRKARISRGIGRLSGLKTQLRAEIGRAMVSAQDLAGVRLKDVVLIDECTARPDKAQGGTVRLKVGMGRAGHLQAQLLVESGKLKAKVTKFISGEVPRMPEEPAAAPPAGAPAREEGDMVDPNQNEGSELLNDIPLQVAVEVARVPISAEEVVSLKVGQVLDLNKMAGEPVELSVNGKIVSRGELVEVDGHLGVRILSIVG